MTDSDLNNEITTLSGNVTEAPIIEPVSFSLLYPDERCIN